MASRSRTASGNQVLVYTGEGRTVCGGPAGKNVAEMNGEVEKI